MKVVLYASACFDDKIFHAPLLCSAPNLNRAAQIAGQARAHKLSFYDASYLELVLRLNGQLASKDKKLIAAAKASGVAVLDF